MCSTAEDLGCIDTPSPSTPSYLDLDKQDLQTVVRSGVNVAASLSNSNVGVCGAGDVTVAGGEDGARNHGNIIQDPMDSCFFQTNVSGATNMIQSPVVPVGQAADLMNTSLSVTSTSSSLINTTASTVSAAAVVAAAAASVISSTESSVTDNTALSITGSSSTVPIVTGTASTLSSPTLVSSPPFHSSSKRPRLKGHDLSMNIPGELDLYHQKKMVRDKDTYCWVCHKEKVNIKCNSCIRSFHFKCLNNNSLYTGQQESHHQHHNPHHNNTDNDSNSSNTSSSASGSTWICFECSAITKAEDARTRSEVLKNMTPADFSELLTFALQTIKQTADITFHQPVSDSLFPEYKETIIHPMDFNTIEKNINANKYGCTEAFIADVKWILHNCYIFNNHNHPLTKNAQYFFKVAKNEMAEIEVCPNCIKNYYTCNEKWFTQPCQKPHLLVWARLKGHPFWPAKAVRLDKDKKEIDCRFFGGHERAWVPAESCYKISEFYSWSKPKGQKNKFDAAMLELEAHISKIKQMFPNEFKYAPPKTLINPKKLFITSKEEDSEDEDEQVLTNNNETNHPNNTSANNANINNNNNNNNDNNNNNNKEESMDIDKQNHIQKVKSETKKPINTANNKEDKSRTLNDSNFVVEDDDDDDDEDKLVVNLGDEATPQVTNQRHRNQNRSSDLSNRHSVSSSVASSTKQTNSDKKQTAEAKKKTSTKLTFTPVPKKPKIKIGKGSASSTTSLISSLSSTPSLTTTATNNTKSSKTSQKNSSSTSNTSATSSTNVNSESKGTMNTNKTNRDDLKSIQEELQQLRKQLEHERNLHTEEKKELKHNSSLVLLEMRNTLKQDLDNKIKELEEKHNKDIELIKRKQWCASCLKESIYFCCWNTSYCSYNCQSKHWPKHMPECQQQQHNQQKANLPKTQSHMSNPTN